MKYASIFFTILLIWLAVILMAVIRKQADEIFQLYLAAIASTLLLFVIGFGKR